MYENEKLWHPLLLRHFQMAAICTVVTLILAEEGRRNAETGWQEEGWEKIASLLDF